MKELKEKLIWRICDRQCDLILSGKKHVDEIPFEARIKDRSLYIMEFRKYRNLATSEDLRYYRLALVILESDISRMSDGPGKKMLQNLYKDYKGGYDARINKTRDV